MKCPRLWVLASGSAACAVVAFSRFQPIPALFDHQLPLLQPPHPAMPGEDAQLVDDSFFISSGTGRFHCVYRRFSHDLRKTQRSYGRRFYPLLIVVQRWPTHRLLPSTEHGPARRDALEAGARGLVGNPSACGPVYSFFPIEEDTPRHTESLLATLGEVRERCLSARPLPGRMSALPKIFISATSGDLRTAPRGCEGGAPHTEAGGPP